MTRRSAPLPNSIQLTRSRIVLGLVSVIVVFSAFAFLIPVIATSYAKSAIAHRKPADAMRWLRLSTFGRWNKGEVEFLRARCHRKLGQAEEFRGSILAAAAAGFDKKRLEREQLLLFAQAGRLRDVDPKIAEIFQTADEDTAEVCEAYVTGLLLNFRQSEALTVIDSWAKDYPKDPVPEQIRSRIYKSSQRFDEAEAAMRQALKLAPNSGEIRFQFAELLIDSGKLKEAIQTLTDLSADNNWSDWCWIRIAKCERLRGNPAAHQSALEKICNPDKLPVDVMELEKGLLAIYQERYDDAINSLQLARKSQPRAIEIRFALARALRSSGRNEEGAREAIVAARAEAELARSDRLQFEVASDPKNIDLRMEIGRILLEYGDPAMGRAWFLSVLNIIPGHRAANLALADHYDQLGQTSSEFRELARECRERAELSEKTPD